MQATDADSFSVSSGGWSDGPQVSSRLLEAMALVSPGAPSTATVSIGSFSASSFEA